MTMSGRPSLAFTPRTSGRVAALGEQSRVHGYALVGVLVIAANDPAAVRSAWLRLDADVALVILTQSAAEALGDLLDNLSWPLVAVMPE
jgi:vacuolar-type H+-ATPase subunit F/Vma7